MSENRFRAVLADSAVWALCDYDTDLADRGGSPSDEHWSTRLDDVNRVIAALGLTVADAPAAEPVPLGHEACPEAIEIDGSASRCGKPRGHEGTHDDHKGATWTIRPAADDEGGRDR